MPTRGESGWFDETVAELVHLLDRLPVVGGLARDVRSLKRVVYERRAPRIAAIGRPATGKSTVLNALLGKPVLPVGAGEAPRVPPADWVRVDAAGGRVDWLESPLGTEPGQGEALRRALDRMEPDCVLLVTRPSEVEEGLGSMLETASQLLESFAAPDAPPPPVVAVLAQVDLIPPDEPQEPPYDAQKTMALDLERQRLSRALRGSPIKAAEVVAIAVPHAEAPARGALNMDRLAEAVYTHLPERAQLEAARAFPHARAQRQEVAKRVVHSCSALAATVAVTPIPLSDIWLLGTLQVVMVSTIAHLSGQAWDRESISRWMGSMGVVGGAGVGFRWTAQQLCKLVPGAGSIVSAGVAGAGTAALGRSAMAYFLE